MAFLPLIICNVKNIRKRGGVQKSMGNKVPWKTGVLNHLPVTSRPLISLQKEAVLSPCNFATTHLTACILSFYLAWTSRPMKRRTPSQRPKIAPTGHLPWSLGSVGPTGSQAMRWKERLRDVHEQNQKIKELVKQVSVAACHARDAILIPVGHRKRKISPALILSKNSGVSLAKNRLKSAKNG